VIYLALINYDKIEELDNQIEQVNKEWKYKVDKNKRMPVDA
jgi:hypothetical protein